MTTEKTVEQVGEPGTESHWLRRTAAVVLLVLTFVAASGANVSAWLETTILDTDTFVETLASLPQQPAVAAEIGDRVIDRIVDQEQLAETVEETLPGPLAVLALPLLTSLLEQASDLVAGIVSSDAFGTVWEGALRIAHANTVGVLTGDRSGAFLTIDLEGAASDIIERLGATGIELPGGGSLEIDIDLFEGTWASSAETALGVVNTLGWAGPFAWLILAAGAVAVAIDRRRGLVAAAAVTMVSIFLDLVLLRLGRASTADAADNAQAARETWDVVFAGLIQQSWIVIIVMGVIALVAWALGPGHRASSLRSAIGRDGDGDDAAEFLAEWGRALQTIIAAGTIALVLWAPIGPLAVLIIATLAGAAIVVVEVRRVPAVRDRNEAT